MTKTLEERFWTKVDVQDDDECWNWTGSIHLGYGWIFIQGANRRLNRTSKKDAAHRVSYRIAHGSIPEGLQVDHLCRNRRCVNPNHLEAVTRKENILRGESVPAKNGRKSLCDSGHEFTTENTRIDKNGGRTCRTCAKRWKREEWARLKARRAHV